MLASTRRTLDLVFNDVLPDEAAALALSTETALPSLLDAAAQLRDRGHRNVISYSRKVFIPLTHLCRDVCHYCTFARPPRARPARVHDSRTKCSRSPGRAPPPGCKEALFTLGDKPELRYKVARRELARDGLPDAPSPTWPRWRNSSIKETGLLPHANPGVMTRDEIAALREVTISQGIMLESVSDRLQPEGPGALRLARQAPAPRGSQTIRDAGELQVPFTSGILIGIGETRRERIESLLALRDLHEEYGHIQEIIVQNFRAKPGTKMANAPEPDLDDLLWTIAVARIVFGPEMNIQAPPNLSYDEYPRLVAAGSERLGRRLAGDARPREPGSAMAAPGSPARATPPSAERC